MSDFKILLFYSYFNKRSYQYEVAIFKMELLCSTGNSLINIMWHPGGEGSLRKNGYRWMYGWVPTSVQIGSVALSCPILRDPMNHSMPGLHVHHQLLGFTQTHVHWVSDAIQPTHPLLSSSPPALHHSQHQSLLKWVSSSHQVAKVLVF